MRESLEEPVSVVVVYDASRRRVRPFRLVWQGREYRLSKVDFYHTTCKGDVLVHHFSLGDADGTAYFKLGCNAATLHWVIEEYMTADQLQVHYERYEA